MSYMKNILYMSSIAKSQGAENYFQPKEISSMLTYNEMEVRLLIQTAIKYMKKSRRTRLQLEDIEYASQCLSHGDLFVSPNPRSNLDPYAQIPLIKLAESCGFTTVKNTIEGKFKAHWLYQKGKVSRESSVTMIRKLRKDELHADKERSFVGNPNLILFNETGRLSEEEMQYLATIQKIMAANEPGLISSLDGNIPKLFSLYLVLIRQYPNEAGIKILLCLVNHPLANRNLVIFQLHHILEILLVYRGKLAYQVGVVITQLVQKYRSEQPDLQRIMERESNDFSFVIKAIAFEEYFQTGVFHCRFKKVFNKSLQESCKGNEMAMICLNLLIKKLPKMACFLKQLPEFPFWLPSCWFQNDKHLGV